MDLCKFLQASVYMALNKYMVTSHSWPVLQPSFRVCLHRWYIHDVTYPVCLEDEVEGEEWHNSKHETQQRRLECGPEVKDRVCTGMHPTCQGRVFLK